MSYLLLATALAEDLRARGLGRVELVDAEAMVARMFDRAGEIARRVTSEADAFDATIERTREAMCERKLPVAPGPARRCETELVAHDGSCEACNAIQGETCQKPRRGEP
ncbi:hypothetical protein ACSHT2_02570 [Bradyrhizobium sp. PUT101]|uniref:hypothetical protein n=1 Tax=Bradyrhizobium sp. PUT101 TaxID=3447427 RepID=UPI003F86AFDF